MHISKKIIFFIKKHEKASLVRKNPIVLFVFPIFSKKSRMCTLTPLCHQKRVYMIVIDHKSRLTSIIVEKKIYIFFQSGRNRQHIYCFTRIIMLRTNIGIYLKLQQNTFDGSTKKNPNNILFCKPFLVSCI